MDHKKKNYKLYTAASVVTALAGGIFGPFYTLFINQRGGSYQVFSIVLGISVIAQAISAYFFGSHSDKIGRKPFLVLQGYAMAIVLSLYLFAYAPWQLYVLAVFDGILLGIYVTVGNAFMADVTDGEKRGRDIGKRDAVINICAGVTMIFGGLFAARFGIKAVFAIMIFAHLIFSTLLLFVKEYRTSGQNA